nr:MAG TPA: hypothetical protein [Caudoviricetes sp.]
MEQEAHPSYNLNQLHLQHLLSMFIHLLGMMGYLR